MILSSTTTTERGKPVQKTANDFINVDLTVHRVKIGSIELYLNHDIEKGADCDEWTLSWRKDDDDNIDPVIIAQGNIAPVNQSRHVHDFDNYGKCCSCKQWRK